MNVSRGIAFRFWEECRYSTVPWAAIAAVQVRRERMPTAEPTIPPSWSMSRYFLDIDHNSNGRISRQGVPDKHGAWKGVLERHFRCLDGNLEDGNQWGRLSPTNLQQTIPAATKWNEGTPNGPYGLRSAPPPSVAASPTRSAGRFCGFAIALGRSHTARSAARIAPAPS